MFHLAAPEARIEWLAEFEPGERARDPSRGAVRNKNEKSIIKRSLARSLRPLLLAALFDDPRRESGIVFEC